MKSHSKIHTNSHLKMDYHAGGNWFIQGPQTPQRESVAKPETPLLIIRNIACKYDNGFSPFVEKQSPWTKTSYGGG